MSDLKMGMRCIKYMLFVVNLMFVLTSVLLITVGTTIHAIYSDFQHFIAGHWFSPAIMVTVVGILMFFVAFFGCCGAAKESTCMVNTFGVMLAVVFILEIAAAITAYALQGDISNVIRTKLSDAIVEYHQGSAENAMAIDFLQDRLECCGTDGYNDWGLDANKLPESCCSSFEHLLDYDDLVTPSQTVNPEEICIPWSQGCYGRLKFLISQSAIMLATGAIAVAFVQLLGVAFAFMLAKSIRTAKTEREARRWQARMGYIMNMDAPYTQMSKAQEAQSPVMYMPASPSVN